MRQERAALVALVAVAAAAYGQGAADPEALLVEARPHLETALGAKLQRLPRVRVVAPAELATVHDGLLEVQLWAHAPNLDGPARDALRADALAAFRAATVAAHREGTDEILVAPANAAAIAGFHPSLKGATDPAFLRLALVHEAARWVLDCRHDLAARRVAARDAEAVLALQALVEGRARALTRQVAGALKEEAAFALLIEALRHAPGTTANRAAAVLARDVAGRRRWACEQGLAFYDRLTAQGVTDAEARAFARPPRQTVWVERPELYLRAERLGLGDPADALARLEKSLGTDEWTARHQAWTPAMLRQAAELLGEAARIEKVDKGWDAAGSLVFTERGRPGRQVVVGLVRFQDAASARAYCDLATDMQRKQDDLLRGARGQVESRSEGVKLSGADEAVRGERRVRPSEKADPVTVTQLWARSGERVVEFTWHGAPGDVRWAQRVLDEVLRAP